jgi:NAD(P)-dependent dehydrogenase (short-subunit alcohol dehydrogenase family)
MKPVPIADKVIAVTGGARGIGLAIAKSLQELGAKVAIGDIDEAAVTEAGSRLGLPICRNPGQQTGHATNVAAPSRSHRQHRVDG